MTVREIARICGVSPATVSRAMGGQAPVNPQTRAKIEQVIAQSQYKPRRIAPRAPRRARTGIIGVMLPQLDHEFFRCVLSEIDARLRERGGSMVILPYGEEGGLPALPLDGVILLHEETGAQTVERLKALNLAMVMCGALSLTKAFSAVHVDDLAAAYDGTNYLLGLGHRDIGFICDFPHSISSGFQRIAGSRKALEDNGIAPRDSLFVCQGGGYQSGYDGAKKLVEREPGVTAIFAHSDSSALGAICALSDMGIAVPEDVSVLGFDGTGLGERCRPRLTCVRQPIAEMAARSLEILLHDIERPESAAVSSVTLPHDILVRDSCRAV